jgi:hypothetical protein
MAEEQDGPFRLSRFVRVLIALACAALAVAHFWGPKLPIDAVLLGLLIGVVVFLFYDVSKIGFGGLEATVTPKRLAEAERRVERAPVPTSVVGPTSEAPRISGARCHGGQTSASAPWVGSKSAR